MAVKSVRPRGAYTLGKVGSLLDDDERDRAWASLQPLTSLKSDFVLPNQLSQAGEVARKSLHCCAAVLGTSARFAASFVSSPEALASIGFMRVPTPAVSGALIAGLHTHGDHASREWIAAVSTFLGSNRPADAPFPHISAFIAEISNASELIFKCGVGFETITRNTGLILPLACSPPETGSGSSKLLPGVLMVPSGVPHPILAECWLHECAHMELFLAEWLSGEQLAMSTEVLPTPWRTVDRPANLLLHGAFVFCAVVHFMDANAELYSVVNCHWGLSATKGCNIRVNDIEQARSFRLKQIQEAVDILRAKAELTAFGKRAMERICDDLGDLRSHQ